MSNVTRTGQDLAQEIATSVLLFFIVFGFAATVHFDNFKKSLISRGILIGLASQFVFMPLIGFAFVSLVPDLESYVVVLILVITSSPGGSYSNLYTSFFNGDLALSVAMTTVSTTCALFMLPLNLFIYISAASATADQEIEVDWFSLGRTTIIIVVAVALGIYANLKTPAYADYYNAFAQICGSAQIIFALVSSNSDTLLWEYEFGVYIVTIFPCFVGLSAAVIVALLSKLEKPQVFTIGMEVCMQNLALAVAVSYSAYSGAEATRAAAVPVLYGIGNFIFATSFAFFALYMGWTYTPKGEWRLWLIIAKNYQPKPTSADPKEEEEEAEEEKDVEQKQVSTASGPVTSVTQSYSMEVGGL